MSGLKIGLDFELPLEVVTEASAIVATRGAGKSSTSAVIVEESFPLGVQTVIFDRTGVYWGLRSSKSGKGPGLGIYVLGGPHGDVPLEPHAGAMIADLVVDSGHSFVLDLSDLSKSAAIKFSADFLERLYDRKARSRSTTLLVIDEAHFYAPQTPRGGFKGDAARLMGAMEDVVGLGRSRGLGVVLTTQRTQSLNKAVLDLIETLIVMRMLSPRARGAVSLWMKEKEEEDELGVIKSLDSLPDGTAWIWSPLRGILEKVAIRRINTFDSFATPTGGEVRVEPQRRAELDLDALGEQMRATVERAKANDPGELRREITRLKAELEKRPTEERVVERVVEVEVSAISEEDWARLERLEETFAGMSASIAGGVEQIQTEFQGFAAALVRARGEQARRPAPEAVTPIVPAPVSQAALPPPPPVSSNGDDPEVRIGKGERAVLEVLAEYPEGRTLNEVAFLAGYSAKASTITVILSNLRKAGLVGAGQPLRLTAAGIEAAGGARTRPTGQALLEQWLQHPRMGAGERAVLRELISVYPNAPTNEELCERTGYSPTASTITVILSKLRKLGLVEKTGRRVTPEFYEAIK